MVVNVAVWQAVQTNQHGVEAGGGVSGAKLRQPVLFSLFFLLSLSKHSRVDYRFCNGVAAKKNAAGGVGELEVNSTDSRSWYCCCCSRLLLFAACVHFCVCTRMHKGKCYRKSADEYGQAIQKKRRQYIVHTNWPRQWRHWWWANKEPSTEPTNLHSATIHNQPNQPARTMRERGNWAVARWDVGCSSHILLMVAKINRGIRHISADSRDYY